MSNPAAWYLILVFNASNWSSWGHHITEFPTYELCARSLSELKLSNEYNNSGVAVVAFCAPYQKEK